MATAMFGAGCFWGVEEAFRAVKGVTETAVGYAGGHISKPTYEQVCSDTTGHAEVVRVEYDPAQVSYEKLLEVFWDEHDPTQVNRQGPDFGTQYRTVIFAMDAEQERIAKESKEKLAKSGKYDKPIATEIVPPAEFWRAEEYHQQYFSKRRGGTLGLFRR
jgi:peptide-methionine (S)-S-oxide reductase